jgi:uncharacterized OsmC-like protein
MGMQEIAAGMQRVEAVLRRRPEAGVDEDAPASARWQHGTRVVAAHDNGTQVVTDMPVEIGGSGGHVTPGWLLRAALASCAVTRIAMAAAAERIDLTALEVRASSRSDARGLLGMADADGAAVPAGPLDVQLQVRIAAPGVAPERLRALVEHGHRCSPVSDALARALPVSLRIDIDAG